MAERDMAVLKKARKSALMTQADFSEALEKKRGRKASVPTIVEWEKDPSKVALSVIGDYYALCSTDAKPWIRDFVMSFF